MTTRIAVSGAAGRMGQAIIRLIAEDDALELAAALEHGQSPILSRDAGTVAGIAQLGVPVAPAAEGGFDVMVEFTTPDATTEHLAFCREHGHAIMIGTTGLDDRQRGEVRDAGRDIPVVFAANTSVGINLCVALLETAGRVLGDHMDVEVVEAHHRHKVDAPSGTALLLGETVAGALGRDLETDGVFAREGHTGPRPAGSIGFSIIRGGDIAGEHTVMFIGESERIEITHRATDRRIFARGALRAARWLAGRPAGFYDMRDVLELR